MPKVATPRVAERRERIADALSQIKDNQLRRKKEKTRVKLLDTIQARALRTNTLPEAGDPSVDYLELVGAEMREFYLQRWSAMQKTLVRQLFLHVPSLQRDGDQSVINRVDIDSTGLQDYIHSDAAHPLSRKDGSSALAAFACTAATIADNPTTAAPPLTFIVNSANNVFLKLCYLGILPTDTTSTTTRLWLMLPRPSAEASGTPPLIVWHDDISRLGGAIKQGTDTPLKYWRSFTADLADKGRPLTDAAIDQLPQYDALDRYLSIMSTTGQPSSAPVFYIAFKGPRSRTLLREEWPRLVAQQQEKVDRQMERVMLKASEFSSNDSE